MSEPDWSESKTGDCEIWKNPLIPMDERLLIADGAIRFRNEQIAKLKGQRALLTVQVQRRAEALAKAANMIESDPAVVDTIWFSMTETLWDYMLRIAAEPIDLSALTALPQSEDVRDSENLLSLIGDIAKVAGRDVPDCVDNDGQPYQSAALDAAIKAAISAQD